MKNNLLTTAQAADVLGVHPGHIRNLILWGKLPAEKMGRDWAIRKSDVLKLLEPAKVGRPRGS